MELSRNWNCHHVICLPSLLMVAVEHDRVKEVSCCVTSFQRLLLLVNSFTSVDQRDAAWCERKTHTKCTLIYFTNLCQLDRECKAGSER